jgi:GNAT superfamily N-acetyltransferase
MDATRYELIDEPPGLDDYLELRRAAGLSPKVEAQAHGPLRNSWFFCHVRDRESGEAVAMGRILGDGGWYFHIADMATSPAHQRRGIGRVVLERLLEEIAQRAPENPYVTLMADPPGRRMYEAAGFRDVSPSVGMVLDRHPTG